MPEEKNKIIPIEWRVLSYSVGASWMVNILTGSWSYWLVNSCIIVFIFLGEYCLVLYGSLEQECKSHVDDWMRAYIDEHENKTGDTSLAQNKSPYSQVEVTREREKEKKNTFEEHLSSFKKYSRFTFLFGILAILFQLCLITLNVNLGTSPTPVIQEKLPNIQEFGWMINENISINRKLHEFNKRNEIATGQLENIGQKLTSIEVKLNVLAQGLKAKSIKKDCVPQKKQ